MKKNNKNTDYLHEQTAKINTKHEEAAEVAQPCYESSAILTTYATSAEEEDIEIKDMPTFSQKIKGKSPELIEKIIESSYSNEDADILILGTLTTISSCLPNIYGIYDGQTIYANLFLFVTAKAASGKGRLNHCRKIVETIQKNMTDNDKEEIDNNERSSDTTYKNGAQIIIPGNCTSSSFYQILNNNNGVGLIFETEGDTLVNSFKTKYGDFSDLLRKAFHHEPISKSRKKDNEFIEINEPKISVLLSGTPRQFLSLIPDTENGLFSRFIIYNINATASWHNVFEKNRIKTSQTFMTISTTFDTLYDYLKHASPIRFELTENQQNVFNIKLSELLKEYQSFFGENIMPSIFRFGLITFRLAMILSVLRSEEYGNLEKAIVCDDNDFSIAMTMLTCLLKHTTKIFQSLPKVKDPLESKSPLTKQQLFKQLPTAFSRKEYINIAETLNINPRTAERYIYSWRDEGKLVNDRYNHYIKK